MKNIYKILFLCLLTYVLRSPTSFSQTAPPIQWQNTIGGTFHDYLQIIQQTADGGYILGGNSQSDSSGDKTENCIGLLDYWIVKTGSAGNIQWENTIGGSESDQLLSIQQTIDGGYILGGTSLSDISGDKTENCIGLPDYWMVKTDSLGNIQWQNTIGGTNYDDPRSIQQTADGGYILGGTSQSGISGDKTEISNGSGDFWLVKTDGVGNIQWQNTIGGNNLDYAYSIQQTTDGGYILGGSSASDSSGDKTENCKGVYDYWIVKTNSLGNIQWENTIGGSESDQLLSIQQTIDGGYILGGTSLSDISGDKTENCIGLPDYWMVKTDSLGNIQWQNTIGGSDDDYLYSIRQTADGGFILGGWSDSNISGDKTENSLGSEDYWIVKTDPTGNIQWQNTIGGNSNDLFRSIRQTADGGYVLGGFSNSGISGDKTENNMGGPLTSDYWLIKLAPGSGTGIADSPFEKDKGYAIFPNPATSEIQISNFPFQTGEKIRLTDVLGNTVFEKTFSSPTSDIKLQTSNFSPGIYFVEIIGQKQKVIGKVVKL